MDDKFCFHELLNCEHLTFAQKRLNVSHMTLTIQSWIILPQTPVWKGEGGKAKQQWVCGAGTRIHRQMAVGYSYKQNLVENNNHIEISCWEIRNPYANKKKKFISFIAPCFTTNTVRLADLYVGLNARKTLAIKHRWTLCDQRSGTYSLEYTPRRVLQWEK